MTVDEIYDSVSELAKFNESGHFPNDTFNKFVNLAQQCLIDYYIDIFERTHEISDSIGTFVKSADLVSSNGIYPKPSDFYYDIQELYFITVKNGLNKGDDPIREDLPARFLKSNKWMTINNSVRGPNLDKGRVFYHYEQDQIQTVPLHSPVKYSYLRMPVTIFRNVVQNTTDFVENYEPTGSVHPEWIERNKDDLIDLTLMYLGLSVRENAIVNWIKMKNTTQETIKT